MIGVFFLFLTCNSLSAQSLGGKLVDEHNEPLGFANVVLLTLPDSTFLTGVMSDNSGNFFFDKVDNAEKVLQVSFIGYTTEYIRCTSGDAGVISMKPSSLSLSEVVVTARLPTFSLKGNSMTTYVQNSLLSGVGTGGDVLKRIPGIHVDRNNNFEVFGKGTPLIYINGRKVLDRNELDRLNSTDIAQVELITNPGAEYDAEVKAVLKIRTIKPVGEGLGGYVLAQAGYAEGLTNIQQTNLNWRKGGLDLFGSFAQMQIRQATDDANFYNLLGEKTMKTVNNVNSSGRVNNLSAQTGLNYIFNQNHALGASYRYTHTPYFDLEVDQQFEVFMNDENHDRIDASIEMKRGATQHYANLYYNGRIGDRLQVDFNVDLLDGKMDKEQFSFEKSAHADNRSVTGLSGAKSRLYAAKLVLSYAVGRGNLSFGGETNKTERDDWYKNPENIIDQSNGSTTEKKAAAFVSFGYTLGKVSIDAGLRYEHANYNYLEEYSEMQLERKYDDFFPTFSLSFPTGRVSHSLAFSNKVRRPYYEQIDGSVQYNNRYSYKQGNPHLHPEAIRDLTYRAGYRFINFSVSYLNIKDYIYTDLFFYKDIDTISLSTSLNHQKEQELNFLLSASPKISFWQPTASASLSCPFFELMYGGSIHKYNRPIINFTLSNDFEIPGGYILSLTGDYSTAGNVGNRKVISSGFIDMALRKNFMNNLLTLNLKGSDLLHTIRFGDSTDNPKLPTSYKGVRNTQKVELTITYRFNPARSNYKGTGAANEEIRRL